MESFDYQSQTKFHHKLSMEEIFSLDIFHFVHQSENLIEIIE